MSDKPPAPPAEQPRAQQAEGGPAAVEQQPPAPKATDTEAAIASAFSNSHDGPSFAAALDEAGIVLAVATAADTGAITAARDEDEAALASNPDHPVRQFPDIVPGELVAVDRAGIIHKLDPNRPDARAVEERAREIGPGPSIAEAHHHLAEEFAPTKEKRARDGIRGLYEHVRNLLRAGANGDTRAHAEGSLALADLVEKQHAPPDEPGDDLRASAAAQVQARTGEARTKLQDARAKLAAADAAGPVGKVDEALAALEAGDRPAALELTKAALTAV